MSGYAVHTDIWQGSADFPIKAEVLTVGDQVAWFRPKWKKEYHLHGGRPHYYEATYGEVIPTNSASKYRVKCFDGKARWLPHRTVKRGVVFRKPRDGERLVRERADLA